MYDLTKTSSVYDDSVRQELRRMVQKMVVVMKDRISSLQDYLSVITFLQELKVTSRTGGKQVGKATWPF